MKKIILYKTTTPEMNQLPVAEIILSDEGLISFSGDSNIISSLKKNGIPHQSDRTRTIFSDEGEAFFENIPYYFNSGYLNAGDIIEL